MDAGGFERRSGGNFSREQAQRIYDASAIARIADSIGLTDADFNLDLG